MTGRGLAVNAGKQLSLRLQPQNRLARQLLGLSIDAQRRLPIVVQGFLDAAAARLPDQDLRAAVERLVDAKLAQR